MSDSDAAQAGRGARVEMEQTLPGRITSLPAVAEASPLREFVAILWKGRFMMAGIFVASILCAVAYVVLTKPTYKATASLMIDPNRPSSLGLGDLVASKLGGDDNAHLQTQVQILQSATVALQAAKLMEPKYHEKMTRSGTIPVHDESKWSAAEREWLVNLVRRDLKVKVVQGTDIVEITCTNQDAKYAADLANAVMDAYVTHDFQSRYDSANQVSEWLSRQMEDIRQRVETSQEKLSDFQKQKNILGTSETDNIVTEKLKAIDDQLTAAEADRIVKEARLKVVKAGNPELLGLPTTTLQLMRTQEAQLQADHAAMAAKFGGSYPKLKETKEQLAKVQANIEQEKKNVERRVEDDYLASRRTEEMLRSNFEQQKSKAFALNQNASQFAILKHEVESSRDLYDTMQLKLKEAGITAGLNSDVSVVDRAAVPTRQSAPRPVFSIFLGILFGVIAAVGGAFAVSSLDDTVLGTDEAETLSRLPVLTAIPEFRFIKALRKLSGNGGSNGDGPGHVEALISPRSLVSEGYRTLHNSIVFSSVDNPPRLLVFTSALPRDGKSTTCLNYATVLAQKGSRVLLVDADLRRPSLARRLGVPGSEGLGSVLLHQLTPDAVTHPIAELPTLDFMAAGPAPTAPADALSSKWMREIMTYWASRYDHVIIDTPPILSVSDSLALAREADGVVLVVRAGKTPKKALLRSRDLLVRMQSRIFGVVLNAVDMGVGGSYYDYAKYGYGYSYGEDN